MSPGRVEKADQGRLLERYAWSWKKLFAFPVGKTWTELKRFWFARSDIKSWLGASESIKPLPFSWLISGKNL
jgi:hypothetical protein